MLHASTRHRSSVSVNTTLGRYPIWETEGNSHECLTCLVDAKILRNSLVRRLSRIYSQSECTLKTEPFSVAENRTKVFSP